MSNNTPKVTPEMRKVWITARVISGIVIGKNEVSAKKQEQWHLLPKSMEGAHPIIVFAKIDGQKKPVKLVICPRVFIARGPAQFAGKSYSEFERGRASWIGERMKPGQRFEAVVLEGSKAEQVYVRATDFFPPHKRGELRPQHRHGARGQPMLVLCG